jgi:hypothetical protein
MAIGGVSSFGHFQLKKDTNDNLFKNADQKEDFEFYLENVSNETYYNRDWLYSKLNTLKLLIEKLLESDYDGFQFSKPSPHYFDDFVYGATSKSDWWLSYGFEHEVSSCFLSTQKERAIDILFVFISTRYGDLIEDIVNKGDHIIMNWKS